MFKEDVMPKTKVKRSWFPKTLPVLCVLMLIGFVGIIPYSATLAGVDFRTIPVVTFIVQLVPQILITAVLAWLGLLLGKNLGLGTPLITAWVEKRNLKGWGKTLLISAALGFLAGVILLVLDHFVFMPKMSAALETITGNLQAPAWQGFIASFYGGIVEEVLYRLFGLTLLIWLGAKIFRNTAGIGFTVWVWVSIILMGILFGLSHLSTAAAAGVTITPLFILRTVILNSPGILFGWLYWRKGLEAAMVSHFCADVMVHVVFVLLVG